MFHKVAKLKDFEGTRGQLVEIENHKIALFKIESKIYAIANACEHRGGPLVEGSVENFQVVCPWHAWAFDVRDGSCVTNPRLKQGCYPTKIEGEDVYVEV